MTNQIWVRRVESGWIVTNLPRDRGEDGDVWVATTLDELASVVREQFIEAAGRQPEGPK